MDGFLALVLIIGFVAIGITITAVAEIKNPKPEKVLGRFEAIDKELRRLHDEMNISLDQDEFNKIMGEIAKLNEALTQKGE